MKARIMYIESKGDGLIGPARIGRVTFSKAGATLRYAGREFQRLKGHGFKASYFDVETGEHYWISGPKKDGTDRLYGERLPIEIDEDVREEYWTTIRGERSRRTASCIARSAHLRVRAGGGDAALDAFAAPGSAPGPARGFHVAAQVPQAPASPGRAPGLRSRRGSRAGPASGG